MFTENVKGTEIQKKPRAGKPRRGRGRPPGPTAQGAAARKHLYDTAIALIAERGYEAATLREVADRAGVSVGLLYRYFPSKRAVVLALYDKLSTEYAERARHMASGRWRDRFTVALETSLEVLAPHRRTLTALVPALVVGDNEGIFSPATAASRERVRRLFVEAVDKAADAPGEISASVGRVLYLAHLAILLFWLLDRSRQQHATRAVLALVKQALPACALALRLRGVRRFVVAIDKLTEEALFSGTETV